MLQKNSTLCHCNDEQSLIEGELALKEYIKMKHLLSIMVLGLVAVACKKEGEQAPPAEQNAPAEAPPADSAAPADSNHSQ